MLYLYKTIRIVLKLTSKLIREISITSAQNTSKFYTMEIRMIFLIKKLIRYLIQQVGYYLKIYERYIKRLILLVSILIFINTIIINTTDIISKMMLFSLLVLINGFCFNIPKYILLYTSLVISFLCVTQIILPSIDVYIFTYDILMSRYSSLIYANATVAIIIFVAQLKSKHDYYNIDDNNLFDARKIDLDNIRGLIKNNTSNILGIDASWGMGKTYLVKQFIRYEKDNYRFIVIDLLSMNLDNIVDILINKINSYLYDDGIYNFNASRLLSIIQKKYKPFYYIFLNSDDSYYDIFTSIQSDIRRLDKPIIVVLDDVDRVDRISDIKRLFYIIEKLSNCSNGKIKFIVQYNSLEFEKKGLDSLYLQKYIPNKLRLTNVTFIDTVNTILSSEGNKYKFVNENRFLLDKIIERIEDKNSIFFDKKELNQYLTIHHNIRAIKYFLEELEGLAKSQAINLKNRHELRESLILACYIKYFIPDIYNNFIPGISLWDNLKIDNDNSWDSISSIKVNLELGIIDKNIVSLKYNKNNFLKMLVYLLLGIDRELTEDDSNLKKWYHDKRVEYGLYHFIFLGLDYYIDYEKTAILLTNILKSQKWDKDIRNIFEKHMIDMRLSNFNSMVGLDLWDLYLKSFQVIAYNWSDNETQLQYIKLVRTYFNSLSRAPILKTSVVNFFVKLCDSISLYKLNSVLYCYLILAYKHLYKSTLHLEEIDLFTLKASYLKTLSSLGFIRFYDVGQKNSNDSQLNLIIDEAINDINQSIMYFNTHIVKFNNLQYYIYQFKLIRVSLKLLKRVQVNRVLDNINTEKNNRMPEYTDRQFNSDIRINLYKPDDLIKNLENHVLYNECVRSRINDNR